MSRDMTLLHPELQEKFTLLVKLCASQGLKIKNTSTVRTAEEQADCVKRGTSSVSWPNSMHNWGVAVDFCRNDGTGAYHDSDGFFARVGRLAESIGLVWGGSWSHPDKPHLQLANWGVKPSEQLIPKYGSPEAFKATWEANAQAQSGTSASAAKSYLGRGDRSDRVKQLQEQLNRFGYSLEEDGIFGSKTEAAVKDYQSKHNLEVDGVAGIKTMASLTQEIETLERLASTEYVVGRVYALKTNLNVRTGPGTGYRQKQRSELSDDGQKNAKAGTMAVLLKGTRVTVKEIQNDSTGNVWLRIPSGWLCAMEGSKVYIS